MDYTRAYGVLFVLVGTVFLYEWFVRNDLASPLLAHTGAPLRCLCYVSLLGIAVGTVAYDWNNIGPTLALKRGVVSLLVAWLLIVPLGAVSELFIDSVWFVGMLVGGVCGSLYISRKLGGPLGLAGGACGLVLTWFLATNEQRLGELEHVIGIVALFAGASFLVRTATAIATEHFEPLPSWPGLRPVEKGSAAFREKREFFEGRSAAFADKYPFWLHLENLYEVDAAVGGPKNGKGLTRTGDGMYLFHGTRRENARGIIADGFRLPEKPGMFGKGIYFADCPLKSWQYTDGIEQLRNGLIFLCWVELGRKSHQKAARNELTRPPHRSFMQWVKGEEPYTSVVGDDKEAGGALRVPEYVVYQTGKIQIDYICEVRRVPPGTPLEENTSHS